MSLLHCDNIYAECSSLPSKHTYLLGSLSTLIFILATFRIILIYFASLTVNDGLEILRGENANAFQGTRAKLSGYLAVHVQTADIQGEFRF